MKIVIAFIIWILCGQVYSETTTTSISVVENPNDVEEQNQQNIDSSVQDEFMCELCCSSFDTSRGMSIHMQKIHPHEVRKFCKVCNTGFSCSADLRTHTTTHKVKKSNSCKICSRTFKRSWCLERHQMTHVDKRPFSCEQCGKRFRDNWKLGVHKRIHFGEKPYLCEICGNQFYDSSGLRRHFTSHKDERSFRCEVCSKCFKEGSKLREHMIVHSKGEFFKCELCDKSYKYLKSLNRHMITHLFGGESHDQSDAGPSNSVTELTGYTEFHDEDEFSSPLGFNEDDLNKEAHLTQEFNGDNSITSVEDQLQWAALDQIPSTSTRDRPDVVVIGNDNLPDGRYIESACVSQMAFNEDIQNILSQMSRTASEIDGVFSCDADRMMAEVRQTVIEETVTLYRWNSDCESKDANKVFNNKWHLKTHQINHADERPFLCEQCGKRFRDNWKLGTHKRIHFGEKPYLCEICGKQFSDGSSLRRHIKFHKDQRSFSCEMCGKCFRESYRLTEHMNVHSKEKFFACELCDQSYKALSSLNRHMITHLFGGEFNSQFDPGPSNSVTELTGYTEFHDGEKASLPFGCNEDFATVSDAQQDVCVSRNINQVDPLTNSNHLDATIEVTTLPPDDDDVLNGHRHCRETLENYRMRIEVSRHCHETLVEHAERGAGEQDLDT
ncbi:hypothetical protein QAD02_011092, partial [Eretmocerus hayati]